jgi:hypothetical protein
LGSALALYVEVPTLIQDVSRTFAFINFQISESNVNKLQDAPNCIINIDKKFVAGKKDVNYVFLLGDYAFDEHGDFNTLETIKGTRFRSTPAPVGYSECNEINEPTYVKALTPLGDKWMNDQGKIIYQPNPNQKIDALGYHNRIFFKKKTNNDNPIDCLKYETIYGSPMLVGTHSHLGILGVYEITDLETNIEYKKYDELEETDEECIHDINCVNYFKEKLK